MDLLAVHRKRQENAMVLMESTENTGRKAPHLVLTRRIWRNRAKEQTGFEC